MEVYDDLRMRGWCWCVAAGTVVFMLFWRFGVGVFFGSRWLCGEMHGGMVEKVRGGSKMQDAMHVVKKKFIQWVYSKTLKCKIRSIRVKIILQKKTYLVALFPSQSVVIPFFFSRCSSQCQCFSSLFLSVFL